MQAKIVDHNKIANFTEYLNPIQVLKIILVMLMLFRHLNSNSDTDY